MEDLPEGLPGEVSAIEEVCRNHQAKDIKQAADEAERALIWRARKEAFGALGTISPSSYTQDGVIPRSALPRVLPQIIGVGKKYGFSVANVFHAGDGNLHPLILYDSLDPKQTKDVLAAGNEILDICLEAGGSLSGEHGIGLEKSHMMEKIFARDDLDQMRLVRGAFNPRDLLNPGKIFPQPSRCAETKMVMAKSGISV